MARFEREMLAKSGDIDHWSTYVGEGAPRFVLSFDVQRADPTFGQIVIVTKGLEVRDRLRGELQALAERRRSRAPTPTSNCWTSARRSAAPCNTASADRACKPCATSRKKVSGLMAGNANLGEPIFDWNEPARVIKIDVLQDKARQLGVSSVDIASALDNVVSGGTVTQLRDDIYLIDVIARAKESERGSIETLQTLQLPATNGQSVPLAAVAKFGYGLEQPKIWRRSRLPTITVQGAVRGADPARDRRPATRARHGGVPRRVAHRLSDRHRRRRGREREGARADRRGGAADAVHHGDDPDAAIAELSAAVPGFRRRPAGADRRRRRVAAEPRAAGLRRDPGGAGADRHPHPQLGDIVVIIQIEQHRAEGQPPWDAVVDATEHRMQP